MQLVMIGMAATALAAACLLAWRWSQIAGEIAAGLEALRRGNRANFVRSAASGPLGRLVRTFNSTATDVQSRVDRLERDRQQLIVVLEAMAEAVIAIDPRLRLLFANAGANRLFGLDATSVGR